MAGIVLPGSSPVGGAAPPVGVPGISSTENCIEGQTSGAPVLLEVLSNAAAMTSENGSTFPQSQVDFNSGIMSYPGFTGGDYAQMLPFQYSEYYADTSQITPTASQQQQQLMPNIPNCSPNPAAIGPTSSAEERGLVFSSTQPGGAPLSSQTVPPTASSLLTSCSSFSTSTQAGTAYSKNASSVDGAVIATPVPGFGGEDMAAAMQNGNVIDIEETPVPFRVTVKLQDLSQQQDPRAETGAKGIADQFGVAI
ncbi:hypothetical protein Pelo_6859 [Pelomyxa schiedti]|nr:hypothetical protein Pelo_6859 [Pelomyxa schiedti]